MAPPRLESTVVEDPSVIDRDAPAGPPPRLASMTYWARVTVTVVLVLAVLAGAWAVRNILVLVLVALVLAVGLDRPVRFLQRMHLSRGWAVVVIIMAAIGFLALFAWLVVPPLVREVRQLASDIPGYVHRLTTDNKSFANLDAKYHISERLKDATSKLPSLASASFNTILRITGNIGSVIFNLLTVFILTVYFLLSLPRTERLTEALFVGPNRERDVRVFQQSVERIGGYVSGNIGVSIIAGIASFIALVLIGVPFAAALAMWVAIADLIPTVGATLGALAAVIVAAFAGWGEVIATVIYFIVYQQVENYLIVPRVMKKAVDLSPAMVIVSVLIGGSLAGFAGALLALPVAAALKVVIQDIWMAGRIVLPSED